MQTQQQQFINDILPSKWTLFEAYNQKDNKEFNQPKKVLSFQSVQETIEVFSQLPHFKPTQLFTSIVNPQDSFAKLYPTISNPQVQLAIDNVFLFRNDIIPEWEDKQNEDGSTLHFILREIDKIDVCWNQLCCMLVTDNLGSDEIINGVRLMERFQQNSREFRIQVWFKRNFSGVNAQDENFLTTLGAIKTMFNYNSTLFEEKGIYPNKKSA